MKLYRPLFLLLALSLLFVLSACDLAETPTPPPFATPKVPPISEVDAAITRWQAGNNQNYLIIVEESNSEGKYLYRIVVADGEIRAAQQLTWQDNQWQSLASLDLEIAQNYTVDALLERVRNDVLGLGSVPMDMIAVFDSLSGYPSVVETQALPTYSDDGKLQLNRKESYTLSVEVKVLIENTVSVNKPPLMILTRSGGPDALCDVFRIFTDGSSVYSDDCRQTLLQLTPPSQKFETLNQLATGFTGIDEIREIDGAQYHLVVNGTGSAAPEAANLDEIWRLTEEFAELLSHPIGAGITLLFTKNNTLAGFDMRTALSQPSSLTVEPPLYDALANYDGTIIAYTDNKGANWLNGLTGETFTFFANPANSYSILRAWTGTGTLILQRVGTDGIVLEWGWTSPDDPTWHPLEFKSGAFSCDTGVSANPTANEIVYAAGGDCQTDAGLTWLNLTDGGIRKLVDSDAVEGGGAFHPAWSPDGNRIAFSLALMDTPENASRLYIVRPDGTELTALTNNTQGDASHPVWSADGTRLYYSLSGSESGEDGIYVYLFASGTSELIIAQKDSYPLSINLTDEFLAFRHGTGLSVYILAFEQVFPVSNDDDFGIPDFSGWLDERTNR